MKTLPVAMLVCAGLAVSASHGERAATGGYEAHLLTGKELGVHADLILARLQSAHASMSRMLFLGYLEEPSRECAIRVNPDDLGRDLQKNPIFSWPRGRRVYLWTSDRTRAAVVEQVRVDRQSTRGRRVEVHLRSETDIPRGWVLMSGQALPEQTWTAIPPSAADVNMARQLAERRINEIAFALKAARQPLVDRGTYEFFNCGRVRTRLGDFLVVAFGTPEEGEFVTRHTVVFKGGDGTWTPLYEDSDLGHELFVDIDGDGVPETVGGTGYESIALWKVYPKKSLEIMSSSGV